MSDHLEPARAGLHGRNWSHNRSEPMHRGSRVPRIPQVAKNRSRPMWYQMTRRWQAAGYGARQGNRNEIKY